MVTDRVLPQDDGQEALSQPLGHQADMRAHLRLSPGRNILGYSNLLRLLEQGFPEER